VQRDVGGVVGDDAAGAQRGGVGVQPAEVVEPELRFEAAGIVFDQRQLHPAHGAVEPAVGRGGLDARAPGTMVEIVAASTTPAPARAAAAVSLVPPGKRFASSHGRTKRLNAAPEATPTTTSSAASRSTVQRTSEGRAPSAARMFSFGRRRRTENASTA